MCLLRRAAHCGDRRPVTRALSLISDCSICTAPAIGRQRSTQQQRPAPNIGGSRCCDCVTCTHTPPGKRKESCDHPAGRPTPCHDIQSSICCLAPVVSAVVPAVAIRLVPSRQQQMTPQPPLAVARGLLPSLVVRSARQATPATQSRQHSSHTHTSHSRHTGHCAQKCKCETIAPTKNPFKHREIKMATVSGSQRPVVIDLRMSIVFSSCVVAGHGLEG